MRGIADGDFGSPLRNCGGSNSGPSADRLLPSSFQQISDFVAVNLNVGAKKLRGLQPADSGDASAALQRGESCGAGARCDAREGLNVMSGCVVG